MESVEILALGSLITAGIALWAMLRDSKKQRKHDRISVRPHLVIEANYPNPDIPTVVRLENHGLGPAVFRALRLFINKKEVRGPGIELAQKLEELGFPSTVVMGMPTAGDAIRVGGQIPLVQVDTCQVNFAVAFSRIGFEVDYASFYDEDDIVSTLRWSADVILTESQRRKLEARIERE